VRLTRPEVLLADAREQEDLVVHRETEQDGEHHHRDEGRNRRVRFDADQAAERAALRGERDDAVSRSD
jgi:hypothetical protein